MPSGLKVTGWLLNRDPVAFQLIRKLTIPIFITQNQLSGLSIWITVVNDFFTLNMTTENTISAYLESRLTKLAKTRLEAPVIAHANLQQGQDRRFADFFWTDGLLYFFMEIKPSENKEIEEIGKSARISLCERVVEDNAREYLDTAQLCHWMIYCIDKPMPGIRELNLVFHPYLPAVCPLVPGNSYDWTRRLVAWESGGYKFESAIQNGTIGVALPEFKAYVAFLNNIYSSSAPDSENEPGLSDTPEKSFGGILLVYDPHEKEYVSKIFEDFEDLRNFVTDAECLVAYQLSRGSNTQTNSPSPDDEDDDDPSPFPKYRG
jgi:hypothetical protein